MRAGDASHGTLLSRFSLLSSCEYLKLFLTFHCQPALIKSVAAMQPKPPVCQITFVYVIAALLIDDLIQFRRLPMLDPF